MIPAFVFAWIVTLAVEVPCVALFYPGQRLRMAVVATGVNTISNLTMNLALPRLLGTGTLFLLVGEAGALLLESAAYAATAKPRQIGRGLVVSAVANALSFTSGLVLPTTL
jgi:hypothetical protein